MLAAKRSCRRRAGVTPSLGAEERGRLFQHLTSRRHHPRQMNVTDGVVELELPSMRRCLFQVGALTYEHGGSMYVGESYAYASHS